MAAATTNIERLYGLYREHPRVTTDSRNVPAGSLFFALRGESFDGNAFAADALRQGAAFAVVDDPAVVGDGDRYILVPDALRALQDLAAHHRRALGIPVIAITGTNGKTTTKELSAAVLSRKYILSATRGNLNNHIGVPLTLLAIRPGTELAIVEMGASSRGEIARLCEVASPNYGIITNIGRAHLEGFGGADGILKAKGELYDWLAAHGGTALVKEDDPVLAAMAARRPALKTIPYNSSMAQGVEHNLAGAYNRDNIAAAMALGRVFAVAEDDIRQAVMDYMPSTDRSRRFDTGRNIVIADCYNANPSSMAAALENFRLENPAGPEGGPLRKVLILGDMFELGRWSAEEHLAVLEQACRSGANEIFLVGAEFSQAAKEMAGCPVGSVVIHAYDSTAALTDHLGEHPLSGCLILVKGSRAVALERVIPYL